MSEPKKKTKNISGTCWDCTYKKPDGEKYGQCKKCKNYDQWSPD